MKLLKENRECKWFLVKEFTTKAGLPARIQQCVWNRDLMPTLSLHDHYTGYVRVPDGTKKKFYDSDTDVHGGVTFEDKIDGETGIWVGFDLAHFGDEGIQNPLAYTEEECEKLARQIKKAV